MNAFDPDRFEMSSLSRRASSWRGIVAGTLRRSKILRRARKRRGAANLRLIKGRDILKHTHWLAGDMVHPTATGHNMMGEQLAAAIATHLDLNTGEFRARPPRSRLS